MGSATVLSLSHCLLVLVLGLARSAPREANWNWRACAMVCKAFRRAYLAIIAAQDSKAIALLCATRTGSGAGAAAVAALSRLLAVGARIARQAAVSISIYSGGKLDEEATISACQNLLASSSAGLRELKLRLNDVLASNLHRVLLSCPGLQRLHLHDDGYVDPTKKWQTSLCSALALLPELQELTLKAENVDDAVHWHGRMDELLQALPSSCLTGLTLDHVIHASAGQPGGLASLQQLARLSLDWLFPSFCWQLAFMTNLTYLKAGVFCAEELSVPLGSLPRLRHLDLEFATGGNAVPVASSRGGTLAGLTYLRLWGQGADDLDLALSPHLQHLSLGDCSLEELPEGISVLHELTALDLSLNTALAGIQWLVLPSRLLSLDLNGCQLPALPPAIANNSNLTRLGLSSNAGMPWPADLRLPSLQHLDLSANAGMVWPADLSLPSLQRLDLRYNAGMVWPADLRLPSLQRLDLSCCYLLHLPPALSTLTALTCLLLCGNKDMVFVPTVLAPLERLAVLDLSDATSHAVPPGISALQALTSLTLRSTYSSCAGWAGVSNLVGVSRLQRLSLCSYPAGIHELPGGLGLLTSLTLGDLADDVIGSLDGLSSLRELDLATAPRLPAGIRALAHITKLWIGCATEGWPAEDVQWLEETFGCAQCSHAPLFRVEEAQG